MRYVIDPSLFWVKKEKESQKEEKLTEQATKPPTPPPSPPKLSGSATEESITFTTEESITFKYYPGFCFGKFLRNRW